MSRYSDLRFEDIVYYATKVTKLNLARLDLPEQGKKIEPKTTAFTHSLRHDGNDGRCFHISNVNILFIYFIY